MNTAEDNLKKETYSRFGFAMISLISSFYYLYTLKTPDPTIVNSVFSFLSAVSLGFGVSKAAEYWSKSDDDTSVPWVVRHTRIKFAILSVACSFTYLLTIDNSNPVIEQAVFAFLGTVAIGLGASKATQHLNI